MFCSKCGAADQTAAFCQSCGAALNAEASAAPAPSTATQAAPVRTNNLSNLGWIFGVISIFILPYVFGVAGLILGIVAKSKGEPRANRAIIISAIGIVAGFIVQAFMLSTMNTGY